MKINDVILTEVVSFINENDSNEKGGSFVVWRTGNIKLNANSGGIWFADSKIDVENFAKTFNRPDKIAKKYIVTIKNPKYYNSFWGVGDSSYIGDTRNYYYDRDFLMKSLIELGYDGIIIDKDVWNDSGDENSAFSKQYVVFSQSQIQSI